MSYPSSLDNISTVSTGQVLTSTYVNEQTDAINAIETVLGTDPQGGVYSTVKDALANKVDNFGYTKGDLLVSHGTTVQRLAVGSNTQVLTADSAQAAGVKWATPAGSSGVVDNSLCNGRLTLTSATPVTTADVIGASTIYFTPYKGNCVALYDGSTAWTVYSFTEQSFALSALATGKNYDLFAYLNSGNVNLELSTGWTSDTARATALSMQDGVYVKSTDTTRRYLGTFRTTGANTTEDSSAKRYVWNNYNRVRRNTVQTDPTGSWTVTNNSWAAVNGGNANWKHEFVVGLSEDAMEAWAWTQCNGSGANPRLSIGLDSSTTPSGQQFCTGNTVTQTPTSFFRATVGIGYHYLQALQYLDSGSITMYGNADTVTGQFSTASMR